MTPKQIIALRGAKKQPEFAKELGISRSKLQQWESGFRSPSKLEKIGLKHLND